MAEYEGARPIEDTGPNQASGAPAGSHWLALNDGSNPRFNPISGPGSTGFLSFDTTGEVERQRIEAKPKSVDTCSAVRVFLIQETVGGFDAASGFMEFGVALYKADGTTLLGSTTAHVPNNYDPSLAGPPYPDGYWEAQEYEFTGLSLTQAEIDAGLIVELDATAADGWGAGGGGREWRVYAQWLGYTYTASEDFESLVTVDTRIDPTCDVYTPITPCTVDTELDPTVTVSTPLEGEF